MAKTAEEIARGVIGSARDGDGFNNALLRGGIADAVRSARMEGMVIAAKWAKVALRYYPGGANVDLTDPEVVIGSIVKVREDRIKKLEALLSDNMIGTGSDV